MRISKGINKMVESDIPSPHPLIETIIYHPSTDSDRIVGALGSQVRCCKIPVEPKTKEGCFEVRPIPWWHAHQL